MQNSPRIVSKLSTSCIHATRQGVMEVDYNWHYKSFTQKKKSCILFANEKNIHMTEKKVCSVPHFSKECQLPGLCPCYLYPNIMYIPFS
jgi:hypothetical protein